MNFSSRSSLVSQKTSRPAFFFPTELSKSTKGSGSAANTSSDEDTACRISEIPCSEPGFNFFSGFMTRLDSGISCSARTDFRDRTFMAEGRHALNLGNGNEESKTFLCHIDDARRGLETRNCIKTNLQAPGLKFCFEGSTPKSMVSENVANTHIPAITSAELVKLFADPDALVIVDCRNFMVYNSNHIKGALNVNLANKITRKRFVDGHLTVSDLVSGPTAKAEYRSKEHTAIIVIYDDNTSDICPLPAAHPLKLLANRLKSQGRDARYLEGK